MEVTYFVMLALAAGAESFLAWHSSEVPPDRRLLFFVLMVCVSCAILLSFFLPYPGRLLLASATLLVSMGLCAVFRVELAAIRAERHQTFEQVRATIDENLAFIESEKKA